MKYSIVALFVFVSLNSIAQKVITYRDGPEGESRIFYGDVTWVGDDWNDCISNMVVSPGFKVIAYWDSNFQGRWIEIKGTWSASQNPEWNDQISSLRLIADEPVQVITYRDGPDGASKRFSGDVPWVGDDWNDCISNMQVPSGYKVIAYWDSNFQGRSIEIRGTWSASQNPEWNDQISSLQLVRE
ncbi:MAG TPA: hypothetical protein DGG95_16455 [Cytophagales bacterium]|jgi:hypothetical protein|nr:hypothetical protein [Cytophagales bacterium]